MDVAIPEVSFQVVSLTIDALHGRASGWTEIVAHLPSTCKKLQLHAFALAIHRVTVNDQPASFDYSRPFYSSLPSNKDLSPQGGEKSDITDHPNESMDVDGDQSNSSPTLCDAAAHLYKETLKQTTKDPELTISLPNSDAHILSTTNGISNGQTASYRIHIDYSLPDWATAQQSYHRDCGIHFYKSAYAITDNEARRTSAWMPCVDVAVPPSTSSPAAMTMFELHLTVPSTAMAIGCGELMKQAWAVCQSTMHQDDDGQNGTVQSTMRWKTFHYKVPYACLPRDLGFVVGPFDPVPCATSPSHCPITVFYPSLPSSAPLSAYQKKHTSLFVSVPLKLYAEAVFSSSSHSVAQNNNNNNNSSSLQIDAQRVGGQDQQLHYHHLPSMQVVFLPPEAMRSRYTTAISLQIHSTDDLINPKSIEQSQAARLLIARALARQWYGHYIRPMLYDRDAWLIEGLGGWLCDQYVRKYLGKTELAHHRWQRRHDVAARDDGKSPPLGSSGSEYQPWGTLCGSRLLDPSELWSLKSAAVVTMLERRGGDELFKKHVMELFRSNGPAIAGDGGGAEGGIMNGSNIVKEPNTTALPGGGNVQNEHNAPASAIQMQGDDVTTGDTAVATTSTDPPIGTAVVVEQDKDVTITNPSPSTAHQWAFVFVDSMTFARTLAKAGDFLNEIEGFIEKWIRNRGAPHLVLGFNFHRRGCILEIAIKQSGSAEARAGAQWAEHAQKESSGIIKVSVREGSGATVDHPVAVGTNAFVSKDLKINPEVKRIPGKRGRKRKDEEERLAEIQAALQNAQHPVQWVRLDPAGEWLCVSQVQQPERMLNNQLKDSKEVIAQVEAVRSLGDLRISHARSTPLLTLEQTLDDAHLNYHVRTEAAHSLGKIKNEHDGSPAGRGALISYYKKRYWYHERTSAATPLDHMDNTAEAVKPVSFPDVNEYLVAKEVIAALATDHRDADNIEALFDVLDFINACLEGYSSAWSEYDDRGVLAVLCTSYGAISSLLCQMDPEIISLVANETTKTLERYLDAELVECHSPGFVVGIACLNALVHFCCSCCSSIGASKGTDTLVKLIDTVTAILIRYSQENIVAPLLKLNAHRCMVRLLSVLYGWPTSLEYALMLMSSDDLSGEAAADLYIFAVWEELGLIASSSADISAAPHDLIKRMTSFLTSDSSMYDLRIGHLVYMALRRLQGLPPNFYVPRPMLRVRAPPAAADARVVEDQKKDMEIEEAAPLASPKAEVLTKIKLGKKVQDTFGVEEEGVEVDAVPNTETAAAPVSLSTIVKLKRGSDAVVTLDASPSPPVKIDAPSPSAAASVTDRQETHKPKTFKLKIK